MAPVLLISDLVRRESNSSTPPASRFSIDTRQQATQTHCLEEPFRIKRTENAVDALCLTIQYLMRQVSFWFICLCHSFIISVAKWSIGSRYFIRLFMNVRNFAMC